MLVLCLSVAITVILALEWWRRVRKLPPGPFPLPLIGNLPHLIFGGMSYGGIVPLMHAWKKKYGNVFTFWLGPVPTVHIADFETAKDAMITNGSAHTGRFTPAILDVLRGGRGTVFSEGEFWQEHRRFNLRTLRHFGLGRNIMEERIMDEFELKFARIEKNMVDGVATVDVVEFFDVLVGSVINRLIFSERFDESNEQEFFKLKRQLDEDMMKLSSFDLSLKQWADNVPFLNKKWRKLVEPQENLVNFIQKRINKRKEDILEGKHILEGEGNDFVDSYLIKMEEDKKEHGRATEMFDEDAMIYDVFDLWIAGQETTAITLIWGFAHLIKNPHVMEKLREEILSVTKGNRHLCLTDKPTTTYLNWTILEIQRLASILNLNLWRTTKVDTVIGGYPVEKGTAITAELSLIMEDETMFINPKEFNPDRYATGGKTLEQQVIPFGIGKRSCLGESLARAELYLILGNMIQRCNISEDPMRPVDIRTTTPFGMMHRPHNYNLLISVAA